VTIEPGYLAQVVAWLVGTSPDQVLEWFIDERLDWLKLGLLIVVRYVWIGIRKHWRRRRSTHTSITRYQTRRQRRRAQDGQPRLPL
jgi:hypothetical protein